MLLVTGAAGFLGRFVVRQAAATGRSVVAAVHRTFDHFELVSSRQADLTSDAALNDLFGIVKPTAVVNCAALTDVDACERDPDRAFLLNSRVPQALSAKCAESGAVFVHISTDSVFAGDRGNYSELDAPAPVNVYARSKLEGERLVVDANANCVVLRTNFVGPSRSGRSGLADWVASRLESGEAIDGFRDVVFSPLFVADLADIILMCTGAGIRGVYHAAARDSCSKYEFSRRLASALSLDSSLVRAGSLADAKLTARRPLNTSLSPARLEKALGRRFPDVEQAIRDYATLRALSRTRLVEQGGAA